MQQIKLTAVVSAALLLQACTSPTVPVYQTSAANLIRLSQLDRNKKLAVGSVTSRVDFNKVSLCRLAGAISLPGNESLEDFVRGALIKELVTSGVYRQEAGSIINLEITDIHFISVTPAYWRISARVSSPKYTQGYQVSIKQRFDTSYDAISACGNTADALVTAVQALITAILNHPKFTSL